MSRPSDPPWFHAGLKFECTRCGRCCRGPGNVWVSDLEIEALAQANDQSVDEFRRTHVRRSEQRGLVLRQKRNQDCILWDESKGCQVYASRPKQCRSYPFWKAYLRTETDWKAESGSCPGVGEGVLHRRESIESMIADDGIPDHRKRARGC